MKKSIKAALLSGLVFPGIGHLYLKRYVTGLTLAVVAIGCSYYLVLNTMELVSPILDKAQKGSVQPDIAVILGMVSKLSTEPAAEFINNLSLVLLFVWLAGIVDSYRVGRIEDSRS
jgi:TM2 domain-containing membrane protein YozV